MTTATNKKCASKQGKGAQSKARPVAKTVKKARAKKPLRIREELLPDTATYITVADREYIAIPVEDFGDWYEDAIDLAVAEDRDLDPDSGVPAEQVFAHLPKSPKAKK